MPLDTLLDVNAAIVAAEQLPLAPPSKYRARAAQLVELYERKERVYTAARAEAEEQGLAVFASACEDAAELARRQAVFFRGQASSGRVRRR